MIGEPVFILYPRYTCDAGSELMFSPTIVTEKPSASRVSTASSPASTRISVMKRLFAALTGRVVGTISITANSRANSTDNTRVNL